MPTYETQGTLVTPVKSFDTLQEPNLDNLQYSLNGQSITVDVVGSPGTSSEEVVTQSLDGLAGYQLDWQNAHSDFRLEITFSTTDDSTSPEADNLGVYNLVGEANAASTAGGTITYAADTVSGVVTAVATAGGQATGRASTTGTASATSATSGRAAAPVSGVTDLPDAQAPTLGNGVEDEVAVNWTDVIDYGYYDVQIRESGQSSWDSSTVGFAEQTVDQSTTSTTFIDREDGEEYEVRMRTRTEHRTGAWTSPVSIITKFPGASSASVVSSTSTSVTVEAQDNADNEDGFRLVREEEIGTEWRDRRVVAEIGSNSGTGTISLTDSTASPGTTYRYRVEAYTEHTSGTSAWTASITTASLSGVTNHPAGSSGWRVRVEHADGSVHRPRTVGSPSYQPTVNGLPKARVPVPQDEKWQASGFERAPVKAWVDGRRLPVDELVDVEDQSDRMVLVLEPSVLRGRVQREFDESDAHLAAESIITEDAGLAASVDDPAASTRSDVEMQTADTSTEFQQELPDYPFPSDDPRDVSSGRLTSQRCLQLVQAPDMETGDFNGGSELTGSGDTYIAGNAVRFDGINETRTTTITVPYDHAGGTTAAWRIFYDVDNGTQEFDLKVDGDVVASYSIGDKPFDSTVGDPPYWFQEELSGLSAGNHTISLETGDNYDSSTGKVVLGCAGFVDDRYETLEVDGGTVTDGVLKATTMYPEGVVAETRDADSIEQVVAGELSSTWTGTSPGQAVAISNDQGASWLSASNSEAVSGEFSSGSAQIRARFTLDSYDSGSGHVEFDAPTAVDVYTLSANLDDTPLLVNKSYDASAVSVVNEIAEYGDFIWQLTWDSSTGGYRVEWTQPGQRTNELDPSVVDYSTSKRMGDMRYGTAVVKGSNRPVSGERFTATAGSAVDLYQDELLEGSEAVVDPSDGTQYVRGDDYTMDYATGSVTVLSSGSMTDGDEYAIDYRYRTQGSYTSPSADADASTLVRDFAGATDDRECGQIALNIIKNIQGPVWEVSLTIDSLPPGQLLVDEIAWPIPTQDRTVSIRSVDAGGGGVDVRGKGQSLGEVVSDIRGRVEANTQRS